MVHNLKPAVNGSHYSNSGQGTSKSKKQMMQQTSNNNVVLGVPADISPERVTIVGSKSQIGVNFVNDLQSADSMNVMQGPPQANINYSGSQKVGVSEPASVYSKGSLLPNSKTVSTEKIAKRKKKGTITPSTEGEPETLYQQNSASHPVNQQMIMTDGGTGASLKRVFLQQDSAHTSQADSTSNYGGGSANAP